MDTTRKGVDFSWDSSGPQYCESSWPTSNCLPDRRDHGVVVHARARASNRGTIWIHGQASSREVGEAESQFILECQS